MADDPGRAADELYGLPLDEFVARRDALARELRAAGDRQGAAEVRQLRKPSLAAWALNRAARQHPDDVARVLEAGAELQRAQEAALAGEAAGLREASRRLGEEVERAAGVAAAGLPHPSATQRDRIAATLRAAAADDAAADRLRRGVLVEDLEPAGFGLGGFDLAAPAAADRPRRAPGREQAAKPNREAREAAETARRELRRAESEAGAADERARRRAERAEAAARRAVEAQRDADAARTEAEEAAGEAVAARRRAEEAAARLAEADAALE